VVYRVLPLLPFLSVDGTYYTPSQNDQNDQMASDPPQLPQRKLLRIAKAVPGISYTTKQRHEYFSNFIPRFLNSQNLLSQDLVAISPLLLTLLNERLKMAEVLGDRKESRRNQYLLFDESALLVQDMTTSLDEGFMIEFKPKWLAQSPCAPPLSVRCRTCALRAASQFPKNCWKPRTTPYCPLTLVSGKREFVQDTAIHILEKQRFYSHLDVEARARLTERFIKYLVTDGLEVLRTLGRFQQGLDTRGVFGVEARKVDAQTFMFETAMTLRDCTLFVKILHDESAAVEARFGDLDGKASPNGKLAYWTYVESRLVNGGWYLGKEALREKVKEETCLLSKTFPKVPYWW
jgi:inositol-pentakisphosphate 2-kinase